MLMAVAAFALMPAFASAQTNLDRISINERSDGKGFVFRYHLTEMADSFRVSQPTSDLIQMKLYSNRIDTLDLQLPPDTQTFSGIDLYQTSDGLGIDIFLSENNFFRASTYPDQNGTHVLLSLERTTSDELTQFTEGVEPIVWNEGTTTDFTIDTDADEDNSFLRLRENQDFNVIVLDAGHGGKDPGTGNGHIKEKDVALAVTLKVGEYLEEFLPEVDVVYTRTEDEFVPLSERGLIATRNKADLFVSIHANWAGSPAAHGTETFFLGMARSESALEVMKRENSVVDFENGDASLDLSEEELLIYELTNAGNMAISERIATMIEDQFENRAQRRSRGIKQAGFEALWHASTPAVLIELGFLSNPTEARFLSSEYGQAVMASAIFRAIRDFKLEYDRSLRREDSASRASN